MPFPYFSAIASGGRVRSTVISRLLDALRYLKGITDDDAVIEVEKPVSPYRSTTPSGSTRAIGTDASGNAHYFDGTAWKSYGASDFGGFAVTPADSPIRKVGSFPDVNLELIDDPGALSPGAPTQPLGILAKHILDGTLTPDKIEASSSHSAGDLLLVSRRNGSMGWGKFLPQTNVTLSGGKGIVIEESGTTFTVSVDAQANWLTPELIKDGSVGLNDFAPGLLFTADKIKDGSVTPEHLSASGSASWYKVLTKASSHRFAWKELYGGGAGLPGTAVFATVRTKRVSGNDYYVFRFGPSATAVETVGLGDLVAFLDATKFTEVRGTDGIADDMGFGLWLRVGDLVNLPDLTLDANPLDADVPSSSGRANVSGGWRVRAAGASPSSMLAVFSDADFGDVLSLSLPSVANQSLVQNQAYTFLLPEVTNTDKAQVSYSVSNLPAGLTFNASTRTISGTVTSIVAATTITYSATRPGYSSASTTFSLQVSAQPTLVLSSSIADQVLTSGVAFSLTLPEVSNAGSLTGVTYALTGTLPTGLTFNASTRVLSGTVTGTHNARNLTYTASKTGYASATDTFSLRAALPALTFGTPTPNQELTENVAFSLTLPEVSNAGVTGVTYSLTGVLPTGLTFTPSTRVLAGTVALYAASRTLTYTASKRGYSSASFLFSLSVRDVLELPDIADQTLSKGDTFSLTLPAVSNSGVTGVAYALSGSLPSGLTFNTSTRVLSGSVSSVAAARDLTYTATKTGYSGASKTFSLKVEESLVLPSVPDQALGEGAAFSLTLPAVSNSNLGGVTYALTGTLPTGLTFDATTRVLSGTVDSAAASRTLTYSASKSGYIGASQTFNLVVQEALALPTIPTQILVKNQGFTLTLPTVTNVGETGVTYALSGTLPTGLAFNATTRVLSGTVTSSAAVRSLTYTASKTGKVSASTSFNLSVADQPTLILPSIANQALTANVAFSLTLPAVSNAGVTGVTYRLTGTLPSGLSFTASSRKLAGTVTAAASSRSLTYTASKTGYTSASVVFSLSAALPVLSLGSVADQVLTEDKAFSLILPSVSNVGVTGVTYALTGTIPSGLTFTASTRTLAGTVTAAASARTLTYTATKSGYTSASVTFSLSVLEQLTFASTIANQTAKQNVAYSLTLPAVSNAGVTGVTYALTGSFPTGITFSASTRVLSGTATAVASAVTLTYTATKSGYASALVTFTLEVASSVVTLTMVAGDGPFNTDGYYNAGGTSYGTLTPSTITIDGQSYTFNSLYQNGPSNVTMSFTSSASRNAFRSANLYIDLGTGASVFRSGNLAVSDLGNGRYALTKIGGASPSYVGGQTYTIRISPDPLT